jgi:hypothetical protein
MRPERFRARLGLLDGATACGMKRKWDRDEPGFGGRERFKQASIKPQQPDLRLFTRK